jgi:hypothetical protein
VQAGNRKPIARVLESRIQPPFTGSSGLGDQRSRTHASRLRHLHRRISAGPHRFRRSRAARQSLARSLFALHPHEPDESGLPVAILRYRVVNPGATPAKVSIAWSIENPTGHNEPKDTRVNEYKSSERLAGLLMTNPELPANDPLKGSFLLVRARFRRRTAHLSQGDGSAAAGGTRRCFIGTIFRPTANSVRSRRIPDRSARFRSAARSHPERTPITRSCWPGIFPTARRAAAVGAPRPAMKTP